MEKDSKEISEPCKFENRVLGRPFFCSSVLSSLRQNPFFDFEIYEQLSLFCSKETLNNGMPRELAGVLRGSFAFRLEN
jgi:hypothetical protein